MELAEIKPRLAAFVHDVLGQKARLTRVKESDGHAGLTFLFDIENEFGQTEFYVIKVPPLGVKYEGNTDVYRQAPLMRALREAKLPVPEIPWAYEDNTWFETPFIVMRRMAGDVFFIWDPVTEFSREPNETHAIWQQCIDMLPRIHRFDWREPLANWDEPEPLTDNVSRWQRIYEHAPEPSWVDLGRSVQKRLLNSLPEESPIGLFHGDYQPGNLLYENGNLVGVIDWELAGIGSQLLDVGWLMMCCDPKNWRDGWRPIHAPAPEIIAQKYETAMAQKFPSLSWFQAFAGYRLASIGCLNVKLHRKGQRHDPVWERIGATVPQMFARAQTLLSAY